MIRYRQVGWVLLWIILGVVMHVMISTNNNSNNHNCDTISTTMTKGQRQQQGSSSSSSSSSLSAAAAAAAVVEEEENCSRSKTKKKKSRNKNKNKTSHVRIVATVNKGYSHFFWNWWYHYQRIPLMDTNTGEEVHKTIVIICEDDNVYNDPAIQALATATTTTTTSSSASSTSKTRVIVQRSNLTLPTSSSNEAYEIESKNYNQLVSTRATHLRKQMVEAMAEARMPDNGGVVVDVDDDERQQQQRRVWVIYTDMDMVWKSFPLQYLDDAPENKDNDMDVWIQIDNYVSNWYCTGFMAFRPTPQVMRLLELWDEELVQTPQLNQPVFNHLIKGSKKQKLAKRLKAEGLPPLKHMGLPYKLFPSGKLYFYENTIMTQADRQRAVIVHANYMVGATMKREQLIKHGLWLVNDTDIRGNVIMDDDSNSDEPPTLLKFGSDR